MATEENKNIARRYVDGFNTGESSRLEGWIAEDCTFRGPGTPPGMTGPNGYQMIVQIYRNAFPDVHLTIDELIAEGDKVVASWHAEGTHRGDLLGIPPTNKHGHTTGVYVLRVSGGRLRDAQIEWDMLGLLQELGIVPMPGQTERRAA